MCFQWTFLHLQPSLGAPISFHDLPLKVSFTLLFSASSIIGTRQWMLQIWATPKVAQLYTLYCRRQLSPTLSSPSLPLFPLHVRPPLRRRCGLSSFVGPSSIHAQKRRPMSLLFRFIPSTSSVQTATQLGRKVAKNPPMLLTIYPVKRRRKIIFLNGRPVFQNHNS